MEFSLFLRTGTQLPGSINFKHENLVLVRRGDPAPEKHIALGAGNLPSLVVRLVAQSKAGKKPLDAKEVRSWLKDMATKLNGAQVEPDPVRMPIVFSQFASQMLSPGYKPKLKAPRKRKEKKYAQEKLNFSWMNSLGWPIAVSGLATMTLVLGGLFSLAMPITEHNVLVGSGMIALGVGVSIFAFKRQEVITWIAETIQEVKKEEAERKAKAQLLRQIKVKNRGLAEQRRNTAAFRVPPQPPSTP